MANIKRELESIHCSECSEVLTENDKVLLDFMNVLSHIECANYPARLVKDIGTYREIADRHQFCYKEDERRVQLHIVPKDFH